MFLIFGNLLLSKSGEPNAVLVFDLSDPIFSWMKLSLIACAWMPRGFLLTLNFILSSCDSYKGILTPTLSPKSMVWFMRLLLRLQLTNTLLLLIFLLLTWSSIISVVSTGLSQLPHTSTLRLDRNPLGCKSNRVVFSFDDCTVESSTEFYWIWFCSIGCFCLRILVNWLMSIFLFNSLWLIWSFEFIKCTSFSSNS